jgi:ribosomal protein S18 acetylase RimI-like enzyme
MSDYSTGMAAVETERSMPFAIRPMTETDAAAFAHFIVALPVGERRFLKESLEDPPTAFVAFQQDPRARHLVAVDTEGEIAGLAGAFPGEGWSSHVAEIRVVVSSQHRRRGLGRELARSALVQALKLECSHAFVEVVAEQEALVAMFQDLGFEPEALLADFVRDTAGDFHDLMLLTHRVDDQWGRNHSLGLMDVIG